jgi:hypothetical protein
VNIGRDKAARVLLAQSKLHLHVNFQTEWHLKVNQALAKFVYRVSVHTVCSVARWGRIRFNFIDRLAC